jgi:2'-5' RNA ligase
LAIELTAEVRDALTDVQGALSRSCNGVRWVRPEQLHLTVKFLGETLAGEVTRVSEAVARSAARSRVFEMQLTECGCFPPRGPVRIVWVGTHEPSGSLQECVNAVEEEMEGIGFPRESRPFSAHLTIGRAAEGRSAGGIRTAVEGGKVKPVRQSVGELTLMSSVLSPKGPSYSVVTRSKLGAGS